MNRQEITQRIAILDKQINEETENNRLPALKHRSFPGGNWAAAAVLAGLYFFGDSITPIKSYVVKFSQPIMILAAIFLVSAIIRTILFIVLGTRNVDKKYGAAMEKVRHLQDERRELQKQLAELQKAGG